jgi:hypothetical protein
MTYPSPPLRLRLHDPADVLAAIPYLLGFHPADSIVALGLEHEDLIFHARGDLPTAGTPVEKISEFARHLAEILTFQGANRVLLVGFGTPDQAEVPLQVTAQAMRSAGIVVVEQLRAMNGRFWSQLCQDPSCCPLEGNPYDIANTVVAAEATLAGCVALPDRQALVRTLEPPSGPALVAMRRATKTANRRRSRLRGSRLTAEGQAAVDSAVRRYAAGGALTDNEVAWLTVLLEADRRLRDIALRDIDVREPSSTQVSAHIRLWGDVVRRCDPRLVVSPAVLLAYVCWCSGDGVRSAVAVDRALAADPQCQAAQLMAELLRRAIPPNRADRRPPTCSTRRCPPEGSTRPERPTKA